MVHKLSSIMSKVQILSMDNPMTVRAYFEKVGNHKKILTNGCFDLLHYGHLSLIRECRKLMGYVYVAINSDESIKKLKGSSRPIMRIEERVKALMHTAINGIIIFNTEKDLELLVEIMKPDFMVKDKSYDKDGISITGRRQLQSNGGRMYFSKTQPISSSMIIQRIIDEHRESN